MNLMFWKKKTSTEDSEADSQETLGERRDVSRKSLGPGARNQEVSTEADAEKIADSSAHSKRRLTIAAAIGVLILSAIGLTTWKVFSPSPNTPPLSAGTASYGQPVPLPDKNLIKLPPIEFVQLKKGLSKDRQADIESFKNKIDELQAQIVALKIEPSQLENMQSASRQSKIETLEKNNDELQTQIEVLKAELPKLEKVQDEQRKANIDTLTKKNLELQVQIEVLKKKLQPHPSAAPANEVMGKVQPPSRGGEIAIGSKSPKATAMTLKEAIEAMNAESGDSHQKAAK